MLSASQQQTACQQGPVGGGGQDALQAHQFLSQGQQNAGQQYLHTSQQDIDNQGSLPVEVVVQRMLSQLQDLEEQEAQLR